MLDGSGYLRIVPLRFAGDDGDIFMRSMIQNYALEQKNKDGSPSGKFWMNENTAWAAGMEVLETHKVLSGERL